VDRDPRFRLDYAALRPRSAHGFEIRRGSFLAGVTGGMSDLCRFSDYDRIHDLFPVGRAMATETRSAGFRRLFPQSERLGLYLPAVAHLARGSISSIRLPNGSST